MQTAADDAQIATPMALPAGALDPKVLFLEDFENGTGTGSTGVPALLANYTNASTGIGYSANPYWSDTKFCNGFITRSDLALNQAQIFNTYCGQNGDSVGNGQGDYMAVRAKAYALGQLAGSANPGQNNALSTNTSGGNPNAGAPANVMFQTATNTIDLHADGDVPTRFIAFSVDAADTTGGNQIASPQMYFSLLQDGQPARQLNTSALPGGAGQQFNLSSVFPGFPTWARAGLMGTYYSDPFTISSATQVGLRLDNRSAASSEGCGAYRAMQNGLATGTCQAGTNGTTNGNDGAIDNIRIVDVTPVLDKEFSPELQSIGLTSTMTLTINNRSDLGEKSGWEFTDTLPTGLQFADSTVSTDCVAPTSAVVNQQAGTLTVKNGKLNKGQQRCTITTTVTSTAEGEYTNGNPNGNFSDKRYIDGPGDAKVTFTSGSVSWSKVDAEDGSTLAGSEWMLTGPEPATVSQPSGGWPVGAVEDCVASSPEQCGGPDEDPAAGGFSVSGLPFGTYTLAETAAPSGYLGLAEPVSVQITGDERDVVFGLGGRIENSRIPGSVSWRKTDDGGSALAGSEWEIVGPAPSSARIPVADCVGQDLPSAEVCDTDRDERAGSFAVGDLAWGEYELIETRAPAGYVLDDTPHPFEVGAGDELELDIALPDIVNRPREAPALPLTGGLGRDFFALLGGGVLALGVGTAIALQLRARRGRRV